MFPGMNPRDVQKAMKRMGIKQVEIPASEVIIRCDDKNIVIYNRTDKANEQFFSSQTGKMNRDANVTSLLLNDGYGYTYSKVKLQQAEYKTLEIFDTSKKRGFQFKSIITYWQDAQHNSKIMHKLMFFIFVSLIPLLSVYLIASFTMINPRYQANHSFLVIFLSTLFFYAIASTLQKWGTLPILIGSVIVIMLLGQWLFKRRVSRYF